MAKAVKFELIDKNTRNISGNGRDKSKDATYIFAISSGKAGVARIDMQSAPVIMDSTDVSLSILELIANVMAKRATAEDNQVTTIYAPHDAVLRVKAAFGSLKNGTPIISEKAMDYITRYRSEEATERYVQAAKKVMDAIATARSAGKLIVVSELDDMKFRVIDGIAGLDVNQTFVLSGQEVVFEADASDKTHGIGKIAKGTKVGKDGAITLAKDVYVRAPYTMGTHKLSVANVYGDKKNRKLVALTDDTKHPELKRARDAYFELLATMNPKEAAAEAQDIEFDTISNDSEIPA